MGRPTGLIASPLTPIAVCNNATAIPQYHGRAALRALVPPVARPVGTCAMLMRPPQLCAHGSARRLPLVDHLCTLPYPILRRMSRPPGVARHRAPAFSGMGIVNVTAALNVWLCRNFSLPLLCAMIFLSDQRCIRRGRDHGDQFQRGAFSSRSYSDGGSLVFGLRSGVTRYPRFLFHQNTSEKLRPSGRRGKEVCSNAATGFTSCSRP